MKVKWNGKKSDVETVRHHFETINCARIQLRSFTKKHAQYIPLFSDQLIKGIDWKIRVFIMSLFFALVWIVSSLNVDNNVYNGLR